jgi:hypothetical protein
MIYLGNIQNALDRVAAVSDPLVQLEYVNRAIENLANYSPSKGSKPIWDPMTVYVDLPVQPGNFVILPANIEKPIKININTQPSFSRNQLFEFTLSSPGSNWPQSGWQWMDQLHRAIQRLIPAPAQLSLTSDQPSDAGVTLKALCLVPDPNNFSGGMNEQWLTLTVGTNSAQVIGDVLVINKPATAGNLSLATVGTAAFPAQLIGYYAPYVTNPQYSCVKLSQAGYVARVLARRRFYNVSLPTDFIPLDNEQAVILMTAAIMNYENGDVPQGQLLEQVAFGMLDREQSSRSAFDSLAASAEVQTAQNLNIITRDIIQVNDIYDDFTAMYGMLGFQKTLDKLTRVVELLANLSHWDPLIGYMDYQLGPPPFYVTLPREVDQIIALNVNGRPGTFRNRWFEFSYSGMGQAESANQKSVWRPCDGWEEWGEVVTAYDPLSPNYYPMLWPFTPADIGAVATIHGTDINGNPLMTNGVHGITLYATQNYATAAFGQPQIATVTRVTKQTTQGFLALILTDGAQNIQTLGTYYPDDIEPLYRRIKVGTANLGASTTAPYATINGGIVSTPIVRFRFRKRWRNFTKLTDIIPLKSATAILNMAQYQLMMGGGQLSMMTVQAAQALKAEAIDAVNKEWRASNPQEVIGLNIDPHTYGGNFLNIT